MWHRRSDLEIEAIKKEKDRARTRLRRPLIYGTLWAGLIAFAHYLGFRGGTRGYYAFDPQSRFGLKTLIIGLLAFAVVSCLVYYRQKRGLRFFDDVNDSLLCGSCQEPSHPNVNNICNCGGNLEPFEYFTWDDYETQRPENEIAVQP